MAPIARLSAFTLLTILLTVTASAAPPRLLSAPVYDEMPGYFGFVDLATDGNTVLTVWIGSGEGVFATIVRPDGSRAGSSPIALALDPSFAFFDKLHASWDGENYLVRWTRSYPQEVAGVYSATISPQGEILKHPSRLDGFGSTEKMAPPIAPGDRRIVGSIATNAGPFVVVYEREAGHRLIGTFTDSGVTTILTIAPIGQSMSVASNGSIYLAAWSEDTSRGTAIYAGRLARDGSPMDGRGILLDTSGVTPAVAFDGRDFVVAWTRSGGIGIHRVTNSGTLREPEPILIPAPGAGSGLAVSSNGVQTLIAWRVQGFTASLPYQPIEGALLVGGTAMATGALSLPVTFPRANPTSYRIDAAPALSWGLGHWILAWTAIHTPPGDLGASENVTAATRISSTATNLDSEPVVFGSSPTDGTLLVSSSWLSVSSSSADSLVVWSEPEGEIRGARIGRDGKVLDAPEGFLIDRWGYAPDVEWSGKAYTVVWNRYYPHTNSNGLVSVRVIGDLVNEPVRVTEPLPDVWTGVPQIAIGPNRDVFIVDDQLRLEPPFLGSRRAVGRFASELEPTALPPRAPGEVSAFKGGNEVVVTWRDSSTDEDAFVVEVRDDLGRIVGTTWVLKDGQEARILIDSYSAMQPGTFTARVWSYSSAGPSDISETTVESGARRRISRGLR